MSSLSAKLGPYIWSATDTVFNLLSPVVERHPKTSYLAFWAAGTIVGTPFGPLATAAASTLSSAISAIVVVGAYPEEPKGQSVEVFNEWLCKRGLLIASISGALTVCLLLGGGLSRLSTYFEARKKAIDIAAVYVDGKSDAVVKIKTPDLLLSWGRTTVEATAHRESRSLDKDYSVIRSGWNLYVCRQSDCRPWGN